MNIKRIFFVLHCKVIPEKEPKPTAKVYTQNSPDETLDGHLI